MSTYVGNEPTKIIGVRTGISLPIQGSAGELFYNTSTQNVSIWNGTSWGAISGENAVPAGTALPAGISAGQMFYLLTDKKIYVFDGAVWTPLQRTDVGPVNPSTGLVGDMFYNTSDLIMYVWNGTAWSNSSMRGWTGSQGNIGYTGSRGSDGTSVNILGSFNNVGDLPASGNLGDAYLIGGNLYVWNGASWQNVGQIQGPQGLQGFTGSRGFNGSQGITGFVGSQGLQGFSGSVGNIGFTGSRGATGTTGFTGSIGVGLTGYTGSRGIQGVQGDQGTFGYTGSRGNDGPSNIPSGSIGLPHAVWNTTSIFAPDQQTLNLRVNSTIPLSVQNTRILANVPIQLPNGNVTAPALSFAADPSVGVFFSTGVMTFNNGAHSIVLNGTSGVKISNLTVDSFALNGIATGSGVQSTTTDGVAGRLLKVGAFGLGADAPVTIANMSLVNGTNRTGFYFWNGTGTGAPPLSTAGTLIHTNTLDSSSTESQIFTTTAGDNVGKQFVRTRGGSSTAWRAWSQSISSEDIHAATVWNNGTSTVNAIISPSVLAGAIVNIGSQRFIRIDAAQSFNATQQLQARNNMGLGTVSTISPTGTASATTYLRGDGTWATAGGFGTGQYWQNVRLQRAINVSYQNTTGQAIQISIAFTRAGETGSTPEVQASTDNTNWVSLSSGSGISNLWNGSGSGVIIPPNHYYRLFVNSGPANWAIQMWAELRT